MGRNSCFNYSWCQIYPNNHCYRFNRWNKLKNHPYFSWHMRIFKKFFALVTSLSQLSSVDRCSSIYTCYWFLAYKLLVHQVVLVTKDEWCGGLESTCSRVCSETRPSAVVAVSVTNAGRHWGWLFWHHCGTLLMHGQVFAPDPWKDNLSIPIHPFTVAEASPCRGSQSPLTSTTIIGTSAATLIYSDGEMKAQCNYKSSHFSAKLPNNESSYLD